MHMTQSTTTPMNLLHCCFNTWTKRHSSQQQQSQQQEQHGSATRRPTASVGVGMWTTMNCFEMVVNSTVAVREGTSMSLKCRTTCKHGAIVPTAEQPNCRVSQAWQEPNPRPGAVHCSAGLRKSHAVRCLDRGQHSVQAAINCDSHT